MNPSTFTPPLVRSWHTVAQELSVETNTDKILQLTLELEAALQSEEQTNRPVEDMPKAG
jgi:hypothetical protein